MSTFYDEIDDWFYSDDEEKKMADFTYFWFEEPFLEPNGRVFVLMPNNERAREALSIFFPSRWGDGRGFYVGSEEPHPVKEEGGGFHSGRVGFDPEPFTFEPREVE